jgi:small GTP-binding protein
MSNHNLIVLGDNGVGKTALIVQYICDYFMEYYVPTIEDSYRKKVIINNDNVELNIVDLSGTNSHIRLNDSIGKGDVFLLVYSIDSRDSFNKLHIYYDIIKKIQNIKNWKNIPIVIVGNKCDTFREVLYEEGRKLADFWNCNFYETSALTKQNILECFLNILILLERNMETNDRIKMTNSVSRSIKRCKSQILASSIPKRTKGLEPDSFDNNYDNIKQNKSAILGSNVPKTTKNIEPCSINNNHDKLSKYTILGSDVQKTTKNIEPCSINNNHDKLSKYTILGSDVPKTTKNMEPCSINNNHDKLSKYTILGSDVLKTTKIVEPCSINNNHDKLSKYSILGSDVSKTTKNIEPCSINNNHDKSSKYTILGSDVPKTTKNVEPCSINNNHDKLSKYTILGSDVPKTTKNMESCSINNNYDKLSKYTILGSDVPKTTKNVKADNLSDHDNITLKQNGSKDIQNNKSNSCCVS